MTDQPQRPLRAALYSRCSTDHQDTSVQQDALRKVAAERGWEVIGEYVDAGVSGTKKRRPALDRLMTAVDSGEVDVVAVMKFDRFARSLRHLLDALEVFEKNEVAFVSLTEAVDTSTPMGRLVFSLVGSLAEFERELIVERIKAGLAHARQRGVRLGRPRSVDVPLEAAVSLIEDGGLSVRETARQLGVSRGTLIRRLREYEQVADDG